MAKKEKKELSTIQKKIIGMGITVVLCAGIVVAGSFYVKTLRRHNAEDVANSSTTATTEVTVTEKTKEIPVITTTVANTTKPAATTAPVRDEETTGTTAPAADISAINIDAYTDDAGINFKWTSSNPDISSYTLKIELGHGTTTYDILATIPVMAGELFSGKPEAKSAISARITLLDLEQQEVGTRYITVENRQTTVTASTRSDDDYDISELFS